MKYTIIKYVSYILVSIFIVSIFLVSIAIIEIAGVIIGNIFVIFISAVVNDIVGFVSSSCVILYICRIWLCRQLLKVLLKLKGFLEKLLEKINKK